MKQQQQQWCTASSQISQYIFEETFNLRFAIPFEQHNNTVSTTTLNSLTPEQRRKIEKLNALDIELYEFAKKLMFQRWVNTLHFLLFFPHLSFSRVLKYIAFHFKWISIVIVRHFLLCLLFNFLYLLRSNDTHTGQKN